MSEFAGKAALVTGAARGIGRATAERLGRAGARVTLVDIDEQAVEETAAWLGTEGVDATAVAADVSAPAQVSTLFGGIDTLDVLVNCAGIQRYGTVVETSVELWDEVLRVNVTSAFLMSKAAIPRMHGGSAIVIVSSTQAHAAQPGAAAYVASKGALNALTRAMAVDHAAEGIRVNAVCPASVDTPMLRWAAEHLANGRAPDELLAEWGAVHPLGRVGNAAEVAELIAFLAGPRASFITGGDYRVDGGLLAQLGVSTRGHG